LDYVICYLHYGSNSCIAAVVYLACEDVVLGHGGVRFFYTGVSSETFIQI